MKKILSLFLILTLAFTACSSSKYEAIPFESYTQLINAVRTEQEATDFEAIDSKTSDEATSLFAMTGVNKDDVAEFSAAVSFMNVSAYCIGVFKPEQGKGDSIERALKEFVSLQQKNMENYLPDQYDIAKAAQIGKAKSGEIVIVMGENSEKAYGIIMASLK